MLFITVPKILSEDGGERVQALQLQAIGCIRVVVERQEVAQGGNGSVFAVVPTLLPESPLHGSPGPLR